MKHFRLFAFFALGLLLGGLSAFAFADTYQASLVWPYNGTDYPDALSVCKVRWASFTGHQVTDQTGTQATCGLTAYGTFYPNYGVVYGQYKCLQGGTLSGTTCTKSCTAPDILKPDGTCGPALNCQGRQTPNADNTACICNPAYLPGRPVGGDWPMYTGSGSSSPSTICDGGCERNTGFGLSGGGTYYVEGTSWTGSTCGSPTPGEKKPPIPPKKPPCAATEGVMTSNSGTVACVPEGTPDARKPDVGKKTESKTYPDGTTETTDTTTTRDPATNATDTTTTTTRTGIPSTGAPGNAGTPGTTTTTSSSSGNTGNPGGKGSCSGDNCTDNATPGKFGEYGTLWEKKYPNGVSGVITGKVNAMKQTPLFGLVAQLAPKDIGNGGTCPTWSFNANLGTHMNFGSGDISVPCWVWSSIRIIFLVTSLLLARRLIFGG